MPAVSHINRLLRHMQRHGVVRTRDLEALGVPRVALQRAVDRGQVVRRARGIYATPDHATTRHTDVAAVAARSPKAIVCLVSALEYHGLTTQVPHAVWIMIQKSAHRPTITSPAIRVVRASSPALTAGVEKHKIEGVVVQMTSPAKTVADCFRYRNTIGTDVAVEALRDCLRKRKATPADIFEMAKIDRVARIMRPYLEPDRAGPRGFPVPAAPASWGGVADTANAGGPHRTLGRSRGFRSRVYGTSRQRVSLPRELVHLEQAGPTRIP